MVLRIAPALVFLALQVWGCAAAPDVRQASVNAPAAQTLQNGLAEYEGRYEYRDGQSLLMVSNEGRLHAIIGDTPYLLRATGVDDFTNPPGDPIPFLRDAEGRIVAFQEYGDTFARLSPSVPPAARLLFRPRPSAPNSEPLAYRYDPPPQLDDGIRTGFAGPGTISPETAERLVNGVINGAYPDVRSILVYHRGALVLEEYFYGYDRDRPHQMRSFTKSVISLLAGAAIDRGLLSAEEPALPRLGYTDYQNPDPRKTDVTLRDLLSNQSGLACNEYDKDSPGYEVNLFETDDWARAFADLPMIAEPGTVARYCSGGFFAAGRIVERAAGEPLPDFAREALFGPLGIQESDWRWYFALDRSQRGEFGQIYLRPRDMLKLGILIQQRGVWQGRQVISAAWIDAATARQSRIDDNDYGLGIWHRWYNVQTPAGATRVDTVMLSGNGGQKVFIVPSLDLIVVSTGVAFFVDAPINEMLAGVLLPALMSE